VSGEGEVDAVVVGAGAAGIGAARRLQEKGLKVLVLEAKTRVGGRALTLTPAPKLALDLGCGWLHSADQNLLAALAPQLGLSVDASPAPWTRPALGAAFTRAEQRAYRRAFAAFEARLEAAARLEQDRPAADLFGPKDARWRPLLDAFSGYYNGAPFSEISVKDYAAYQPTSSDWRVVEGYGVLVERLAGGIDVRLSTPVNAVTWSERGVALRTPGGLCRARAAVLAAPTSVLARIAFDPPLPRKLEAAAALPLGHVEKAFLRLDGGGFARDVRVIARTDTAETGSYTLRPLGMPAVECFFGGALAAALGRAGPAAMAAFAVDELAAALGSDIRSRVSLLAASSWAEDPDIRGAYSHAEVGAAGARAELARPEGRLFFAGEAVSAHAFSTAHGAFETGLAAADAAAAALGRSTPAAT
jgi:monoamine oxidase